MKYNKQYYIGTIVSLSLILFIGFCIYFNRCYHTTTSYWEPVDKEYIIIGFIPVMDSNSYLGRKYILSADEKQFEYITEQNLGEPQEIVVLRLSQHDIKHDQDIIWREEISIHRFNYTVIGAIIMIWVICGIAMGRGGCGD